MPSDKGTNPKLDDNGAIMKIFVHPLYQAISWKPVSLYYMTFKNRRRRKSYLIYLLNAIGLTPDGSNTVHIYTQTIHRTTQLTTLFGRLSGIRTQIGQTKIKDEITA